MNAISRWSITAGVCLLIFVVLAGYKYFQIQAAIAYGKSFPEPSATVEATTVSAGTLDQQITTLGEIVAPQAVELRTETEGRIAEVNFTSGSPVEENAILLQLDVSEENAHLQAAQARAELARLDLERMTRLVAQKTISEERADQARAQADIAAAEVRALRAVIAKKTVRAPFAAIAGLHDFEVGEFLSANTPIVTLVGINDHTWVDFSLPMNQADLDIGSPVSISLREGAKPLMAEVIARDSVASASSRTLRFRARIDNGASIPPNAVVKVSVPLAPRAGLVIPATALLKDSMGDYVYALVANASGKGYRAQRRAVTIAGRDDQTASISAGLNEGELVATQGAFKLQPQLLAFVGGEADGAGAAH